MRDDAKILDAALAPVREESDPSILKGLLLSMAYAVAVLVLYGGAVWLWPILKMPKWF